MIPLASGAFALIQESIKRKFEGFSKSSWQISKSRFSVLFQLVCLHVSLAAVSVITKYCRVDLMLFDSSWLWFYCWTAGVLKPEDFPDLCFSLQYLPMSGALCFSHLKTGWTTFGSCLLAVCKDVSLKLSFIFGAINYILTMDNETNTDQEICGDLSTPDSFSYVWADLMNILVSSWIFISFSVFSRKVLFLWKFLFFVSFIFYFINKTYYLF